MTKQENSSTANPTGQPSFYDVLRLDKGRRRWRLVAVVAVFFFLVTAFALNQTAKTPHNTPHIAHIQVEGILQDSLHQQKVLEQLREHESTKAVIVYVDSPGGTMVGGLNLHQALRRVAAEKPVVTVMGTVAASAGYMVSLAGDHVIASPGSLTGSIGVMMPLVDATDLASKIGIQSEEVVSGDLKTATSPLRDRTARDNEYLKETVMEMQTVFLELITSRRDLTEETLATISDGRILTGVSAHRLGLVDALGDRNSGRAWLEQNKGISADIPLIDVSIEKPKGFWETFMHGARSLLFSKEQRHGIMAM